MWSFVAMGSFDSRNEWWRSVRVSTAPRFAYKAFFLRDRKVHQGFAKGAKQSLDKKPESTTTEEWGVLTAPILACYTECLTAQQKGSSCAQKPAIS
jgi:hypothetical protein